MESRMKSMTFTSALHKIIQLHFNVAYFGLICAQRPLTNSHTRKAKHLLGHVRTGGRGKTYADTHSTLPTSLKILSILIKLKNQINFAL